MSRNNNRCRYCNRENHKEDTCEERYRDRGEPVPSFLSLEFRSDLEVTYAFGRSGFRRFANGPLVYPQGLTLNYTGNRVEIFGFPAIYIVLADGQDEVNASWAGGRFGLGERYSIGNGVEYWRTKQDRYQPDELKTPMGTIRFAATGMFKRPIGVTVFGYEYQIIGAGQQAFVMPSREAIHLVGLVRNFFGVAERAITPATGPTPAPRVAPERSEKATLTEVTVEATPETPTAEVAIIQGNPSLEQFERDMLQVRESAHGGEEGVAYPTTPEKTPEPVSEDEADSDRALTEAEKEEMDVEVDQLLGQSLEDLAREVREHASRLLDP